MSEQTVTTESEITTTSTGSDWRSSLSPELRELPNFNKFKTTEDLAKSYMNLEKLVGLEKLPLPKDDKDEAGWATVYSRLGRPENPDKYEVSLNLTEGLNVPEEYMKSLRLTAHKLGLSTKQLQGILDHWSDLENKAYEQRLEMDKNSIFEAETAIRKKYGSGFEQAKTNIEAVIKNFAEKEDQEEFGELVKRNPRLFNLLSNVSKNFSEDSLKGSAKRYAMTPEEANREYLSILGDKNHPYHKADHPEHDLAVNRVIDLQMMISPELAKISE